MKLALAALIVFAFVAVGCQDKKPADTKPAVTDISPTPPSYSSPAMTTSVQPVSDTPVVTTATPDSTRKVAGGSYTVKKGDTLYAIAKAKYGSGKEWQKIAAANPGINPNSLKVGQTLTLP